MTNEQAIDEIMAETERLEDYAVAYEKGGCYDLPSMRNNLRNLIAAALAAKDEAAAVMEAESAAMADALRQIAESMGLGVGHTAAEIVAALKQRLLLEGAVADALADAERKGAEQMREAAVAACDVCALSYADDGGSPGDCAQAIRDLPLPTGSQPAEAKTGEWIKWEGGECPIASDVRHQVKFRDEDESGVGIYAYRWDWSRRYGDHAIVAYRVLA